MFQNKKFTYFLLPMVLFLWMIILYRVFFNNVPNENSSSNQDEDIVLQKQIQQPARKYKPTFQNTNPFAIETGISKERLTKKTIPKARKKPYTGLEYLGYTENGNSKLANILFNSRYYILNTNDSLGDYILLEIQNDSIVFKSSSDDFFSIKKKNL